MTENNDIKTQQTNNILYNINPTARGDVLGNAKSGASENLRVFQKHVTAPKSDTLKLRANALSAFSVPPNPKGRELFIASATPRHYTFTSIKIHVENLHGYR